MLFADKAHLQRQLEVDLLNLRQKELQHFTTCCLTLSSPAALIAGFAYTGIAEVSVAEGTHWAVEALYYALTVTAMLLQIAATIRSSLVALMGPALALRGKSGAMHRSVEAMEPCFKGAWQCFIAGMFFWLMSTLVNLFIQSQHWGIGLFVGVIIMVSTVLIYRDIAFISMRFNLPLHQVERGSFSRQEVARMFRRRGESSRGHGSPGTRRDRNASPSASATADTSSHLILAAQTRPNDSQLKSLTRQKTVIIRGRGEKRTNVLSANRCAGGGTDASPARSSPAASSSEPHGRGARARLDGGFEESEFQQARRGPVGSADERRTVTFEVDSSEQPVASTVRGADGGSFGRKGRAPRPVGGGAVTVGDGGYLPCVSSGRAHSAPPEESAAAGVRRGPAAGWSDQSAVMAPDGDALVNVVLTVREGKRLRWQVPPSTTIAELHEQAEKHFGIEIASLIDAHGATFANPHEEPVFRHTRSSGEEKVAFFEVLPRSGATSSSSSSFARMMWGNFLGQI